ncbi:MAG TPA: glycerol kinase GlpK [Gaiellaceae bacterium]|nr:glycerol kinase GlpK [Gaiellaceae bacterium]
MILAVDQGTTGTTCLVVGEDLRPRGRGYREVPQHFPRPGWVEHEPEELWESVLGAAADALADAGLHAGDLAAVGVTNQRETTVVWERRTGRPVHRAIVWQDRRTAERCRELPAELLRDRTGLVPDPYFSATKLEWILSRRDASGLAFGTVDSWLAWKLTGGAVHATDVSNASRTLLFDLRRLAWDAELLELFGVPDAVLPDVVPTSGVLGEAELLGARVPLAALAGDQQAALFGQACFRPGQAKVTYGTGSFVLANAGDDPGAPREGLVQTVAWRLGAEPPAYALEGSVFVTGAALQWLRDGLGLLDDAADSEALASSLAGNDGVYFVPALAGLGAPHWAPEARGLIAGLDRGTRREHLVRAALEAIAYQVRDVLDAMGREVEILRADGGGATNRFLLQFQADTARIPVEVPAERETTALGAAALAGLAVGVWSHPGELADAWRAAARYRPEMAADEAERLVGEWRAAVRRTLLPPA